MILAGHDTASSVLSVAAAGGLRNEELERTYLVSFGSPLGTLYGPVYRAAISPHMLDGLRRRLAEPPEPTERSGGQPWFRWCVFWRRTDPIGGPIFGDAVDRELPDPPAVDDVPSPEDIAGRPPLDRPTPPGVTRSHGWYPAENSYRKAVADAAATFADREERSR